jgi:replicative DNA helicase
MEEVKSLDDLVPGLRTAQFGWTENIRRCLLHLLVNDSEFFASHKDALRFEFFPDNVHGAIFQIVKAYHDKYHILPSQGVAYNEIRSVWRNRPAEWAVAETEFYSVYEYHEEIADKEYLHDKLVKFCRREAFKQALTESYQTLIGSQDDDFDSGDQVEQILRRALMVGTPDVDVIDYFDHFEERYHQKLKDREQNRIDRFATGFPSIDNELEGGIGRKEIGTFLGDSATGKSFLLNHVAVQNVLSGWNVLYVTLENSSEVVQDRLDAAFTQIRMRNLLSESHSKTLVKLRELRDSYKSRLKIMEFEEGSMFISNIRAMVDKMYIREGWRPDVVVLDYIDEIASHKGMNDYDSQGINTRDFRGWMKHLNAGGFTATQANRDSSDAEITTRKNIGDSYKKLRRTDYMWSVCITPDEDIRGLCRLFCIKHRNGKQEYLVYLERELGRAYLSEIGQKRHEEALHKPAPGQVDRTKSKGSSR